jgi:hypothetical protein
MKPQKTLQRAVLLAVAAASSLCACRGGGKAVAFADVCREEQHALVSLEGYLRLPVISEAGALPGSRQLLLVEKANGAGGFLPVVAEDSQTGEPNHVAELPLSYTYKDFRIFTDDGAEVNADERLRVTGEVVKDFNLCALRIHRIEARPQTR